MADSDNFDSLKSAENLSYNSVLSVMDGGYKRKTNLTDVAAVMQGGFTTASILASKLAVVTDSVTDNTDGTADVTLTFYRGGVQLTTPLMGTLMVCDEAVGIAAVAIGTGLTAVKGQLTPLATTSIYHFVTNATGELDITLDNGSADSFWLFFRGTAGEHLSTDEIAITGP